MNKKLKNCAMTVVLKTRFTYTTITHKISETDSSFHLK